MNQQTSEIGQTELSLTHGMIVSTRRDGHICTEDYPTDDLAVQAAYDRMIADPALPRTLILHAPDRPFAFAGPLTIWQSHCRVTSTGGVTITPAESYTGPLITSERRSETEWGEDELITDVVIDHLWLNGHNRSLGIKLKHLQLSTIHDLHIRQTDGPGLWLSDFCIENLFSNLILSDECGNETMPALLIQTESNDVPDGVRDIHNSTVNSTRFAGTMIHFPTNAAMEIHLGEANVPLGRRHRKIQFSGCYFHAHPGHTAPLVTIGEAFELAFVGTQMLAWSDELPVLQMGVEDAKHPAGLTMISHCFFGSKPDSNSPGIKMVNVERDVPSLSVFGNSFGSTDRRLGHAVDWGTQGGVLASWAANCVHVSGDPYIGLKPSDADISPFN